MNRRLLIVAVFLLAGAVVNVAVAWVCAIGIDGTQGEPARGLVMVASESWQVTKLTRPGATVIISVRNKGLPQHREIHAGPSPDQLIPPWADQLVTPTQIFRSTEAPAGSRVFEFRILDARGWPMRSLWFESMSQFGEGQTQTNPTPLPAQGALKISSAPPTVASPRVLPLRSIRRGFAVNTLFYAALLWLPFAPFALRRLIRQRRGLCPACAYDLRHAEHKACPECGVTA